MLVHTSGSTCHAPAAVLLVDDESWGIEATLDDEERHYCAMLTLNASGETFVVYAKPKGDGSAVVDEVVRQLTKAYLCKDERFDVERSIS